MSRADSIIQARIDTDVYARISELASSDGQTVSAHLRNAIALYLDSRPVARCDDGTVGVHMGGMDLGAVEAAARESGRSLQQQLLHEAQK